MTAITKEEIKVKKGDVTLSAWRKRAAGAGDLPVLALVHGSSTSALPTFDLTVPGKPEYSMMDWFAARGFDVWALDHEGYGASTITENNSDIKCGVADLQAMMGTVMERTGRSRMLVYGLSSGALRAAAFAQAAPQSVQRLALDAFVWTGRGSPTLAKRREGLEFFRNNARREISEASLTSIFTRDHPGLFDPAVAKACAAAQLAYGNSVPTGSYLDMTANLPLVDPAAITTPTLIVRPEHDGIATVEDLIDFFSLLPSADKQFTMIPDLTHTSTWCLNRKLMWHAVHGFFTAG